LLTVGRSELSVQEWGRVYLWIGENDVVDCKSAVSWTWIVAQSISHPSRGLPRPCPSKPDPMRSIGGPPLRQPPVLSRTRAGPRRGMGGSRGTFPVAKKWISIPDATSERSCQRRPRAAQPWTSPSIPRSPLLQGPRGPRRNGGEREQPVLSLSQSGLSRASLPWSRSPRERCCRGRSLALHTFPLMRACPVPAWEKFVG
jgi:hypothetical protein